MWQPPPKKFKMPFIEFSLDLIEQGMLLSIFKNYIGSQFHPATKYNFISTKGIKLSQPTYLSSLIKTTNLTHGNWLYLPQLVLERPLIGEVLQWVPH